MRDLLSQRLISHPCLLQLPGYFHCLITSKSYWFSLRMTLRRPENWGASACDSLTEQKLNSSLCSRGTDKLSSRGSQSYKVESSSFAHIATGMREGMKEKKMRLIILPAEKQEYPLAFYRGDCQDMIPWWVKKMSRERKIWQIRQKLEYRLSVTGLSLHLWRLVSNGCECHIPSCWRSEETAVLLHLLSKQKKNSGSSCFLWNDQTSFLYSLGDSAAVSSLFILSGMNSCDLSQVSSQSVKFQIFMGKLQVSSKTCKCRNAGTNMAFSLHFQSCRGSLWASVGTHYQTRVHGPVVTHCSAWVQCFCRYCCVML